MKKTICLNMIVKDEAPVILRCLESVKPIIDYWVIVDTGSTDGTQQIIRDYLKDIPGHLHERPWVNFGHNRQEAKEIALGCSDYLFFIDADDQLVFEKDFVLPDLKDDIYFISQRIFNDWTSHEHYTIGMIKNNTDHQWKGAVHEHITSRHPERNVIGRLKGVYNKYNADGARNQDPQKAEKDLVILKAAIEKDPLSSRDILYLGRTYFYLERFPEAITQFKLRSRMGGDPAEVYYSLLYVAISQVRGGYPPEVFLDSFANAYISRPFRAEAIYELARYYTNTGMYALGYFFAKRASAIPMTTDTLFIEPWVYDWGSKLYLFLCAHALEKTEEASELIMDLMCNEKMPDTIRRDFNLKNLHKYYFTEAISF